MTGKDARGCGPFSLQRRTDHEGRRPGVCAEVLRAVGVIAAATLVATLLDDLGFTEASIVITYVLGVLVIALVTSRHVYCPWHPR